MPDVLSSCAAIRTWPQRILPSGFSDAAGRISNDVVADLPPEDLPARLARRQYVIDRLQLDFARDAAEFAASDTFEKLESLSPVDWIRHNCKTSASAAADRLNVGRQLPTLPKSTRAVIDGEIGFAHLSVIARTSAAIADCTAEAMFDEDEILDNARESSAGRLWHYCMRLRHALNPEAVAHEQRVAAEQRALRFSNWEDGSLLISGQLDPIGGAAVRTALEPLARPMGEGDGRCLERRQADALVELATLQLDAGRLPHVASQRPHLQVTVTLETLRELPGSPAADMEFSGPISTRTLERIACDPSISRVVFSSPSVVAEVGRAKRLVAGPLRRALNARDQHCRWPGCERPASWSAAHHFVHWIQGGDTNLPNLVLLCHRHHWMVHEGNWKLVRTQDDRLLTIPPTYDYYGWARAPDQASAA